MSSRLLVASIISAGMLLSSEANAVQVLSLGDVSIGVQDLGALGGSGVGIQYKTIDGITPGCLCEGWGASYNLVSGWSANANGGDTNVSLISFSSTSSSATSVVGVGSALQVTQAYTASSSPALFLDKVTLTNTTGASIADVRYSRSMDWDIPNPGNEVVTLNRGTSTALLFSNDNGFATPDPLVNPADEITGGFTNVNFVDSGPNDHGAFFTFGFGGLAAGESKSFNIFYGAAGTEADAFAALGAVGAEVYSFGQYSGDPERGFGGDPALGTPATYIFGFSGVGGTPVVPSVPEPETYGMLMVGLGLMGFVARRRKENQA